MKEKEIIKIFNEAEQKIKDHLKKLGTRMSKTKFANEKFLYPDMGDYYHQLRVLGLEEIKLADNSYSYSYVVISSDGRSIRRCSSTNRSFPSFEFRKQEATIVLLKKNEDILKEKIISVMEKLLQISNHRKKIEKK